jgi:hypothetical protein
MPNLPHTPSEAKRLESRLYFTGKPCSHGHTGPRLTRSAECVQCRRDAKVRYKKRHPERRRASQNRRMTRPEVKRKRDVRCLVYYAIKTGVLTPAVCKCGSTKTEAHHEDYSKPLDVDWVCRKCHQKIHGNSKVNP